MRCSMDLRAISIYNGPSSASFRRPIATGTGSTRPTAVSSLSAAPASTARSPVSDSTQLAPACRTRSTLRSVGMVPSAHGGGYFMVAADKGVFAFGDARFAGSCPGIGEPIRGEAVAVMPDASGNGYWVVTQTGHVYAFGDALYYGAPGPQSVPVTSAVRTPDGRGYWILFANGAIANYGDAGAFGHPVGRFGGFNPTTAMFATWDGGGYWVASANGSVDNYGDAPTDGGMSGTKLNGPIIAATGW